MSHLELRTLIEAPVEQCFDLSCDVDVHVESMASSRERAVAGVTSGLIGLGEEVSWEARHLGRSWTMRSQITEFERPTYFVDEMQQGPFSSFRHEHHFAHDGAVTTMVDIVDYRSPFGLLGAIADAVIVGRYLSHLLEVRNHYIKKVAEAGPGRRG